MLAGRQPFPVPCDKRTNKPLLTELYKMQRAGVQLSPIELCPDLPEAAQTAILRALAFDPQARHAEARDFGEELAQALTDERLRASSSAPTETITPGIDERTATLSTIVRVKPESAEVVISFAAQDLGPRAPNRRAFAEGRRRVLDGRSRPRSYVGRPLRNNPGDQTVQSPAAAAAPTPRCNRTRSNRTCNWPGATSGLTCRCSSNGLISPSRPSTGSKAAGGSKRPPSRPTTHLSQTLQSLSQSGVRFHDTELPTLTAGQAVQPIPLTRLDRSLQSRRKLCLSHTFAFCG
jgi:hypothetical protein